MRVGECHRRYAPLRYGISSAIQRTTERLKVDGHRAIDRWVVHNNRQPSSTSRARPKLRSIAVREPASGGGPGGHPCPGDRASLVPRQAVGPARPRAWASRAEAASSATLESPVTRTPPTLPPSGALRRAARLGNRVLGHPTTKKAPSPTSGTTSRRQGSTSSRDGVQAALRRARAWQQVPLPTSPIMDDPDSVSLVLTPGVLPLAWERRQRQGRNSAAGTSFESDVPWRANIPSAGQAALRRPVGPSRARSSEASIARLGRTKRSEDPADMTKSARTKGIAVFV